MGKNEQNETREIIKSVLENRRNALSDIYRLYRSKVFLWAKKRFSCNQEDIFDAYQEALIILIKDIRRGKFTGERSSALTYIISICYNKLLKNHEKHRRIDYKDDINETLIKNIATDLSYKQHQSELIKLIRNVIRQLDDKCRQILLLFYFNGYDIESIQLQMGYSSNEVVRTTKKRCVQKLTKNLFDQL